MISPTQLEVHLAVYPNASQRTTALELRIQIGTGFHGKWYRSQRERMLGWMVVQECQERKKGNDPLAVDAKGMWGRLKCGPLMCWLAECSSVSDDILVRAQEMVVAAARINDNDADPHKIYWVGTVYC